MLDHDVFRTVVDLCAMSWTDINCDICSQQQLADAEKREIYLEVLWVKYENVVFFPPLFI